MNTSLIFANMQEKTLCWREDNDCSVKAIAIALDICYAESWYACRKVGRKYKLGMSMDEIQTVIKRKNKDVVEVIFEGSIIKFMQQYPTGSFIFEIKSHIMAYKDGVIHDDTDNWYGPLYKIWHILEPMDG